jgi:SNF2 family DNA or RNA helicase
MKTPRHFQQTAIDRAIASNLLVADETGLGKSLTAIAAAQAALTEWQKPVLVVCPKRVRLQWLAEIQEQAPYDEVVSYDGTPFNAFSIKPDWVIIHYEALSKYALTFSKAFWSAVIVDEAHRIKNRKTERAKLVKGLKSARRIALTGTPWDKNPADVWSILNWLEPGVFRSYWKFSDAHVNMRQNWHGNRELVKEQPLCDPANFAKVLAPYMVQRSKAEVAPELPPKTFTFVPVELGTQQRKYYDAIEQADDLDVLDPDTGELTQLQIKNVMSRMLRLQQCASDPALVGFNQLVVPAKLQWLQDWLEDNPNEHVIVFSRFRDTAKAAAEMLEGALIIGGAVAGHNGYAVDPSKEPRIAGTIAAMSEGLNLDHIHTAIFLESDWDSILMRQSFDRIHRLTSTVPKQLIFLEAVNSVDAVIRATWQRKLGVVEMCRMYLKEVRQSVLIG